MDALTGDRSKMLLELVRELHEGILDASSMPQRLVDTLCREGEFAGIAILLLDRSKDALVGVAHAGVSARYPATRIPRGKGISWEVLTTGRTVYVADLTRDPRTYVPGGQLDQTLSAVFVPLRGRGEPFGVLVIHAPGRDAIQPEDRTFLERVAVPLSLALENATLYERLERAVSLREDLLEVTRALAASELDLPALFHRVVQEAVRLVPGAERGSLSVREGEEYVFAAAVGYDLGALRGVRFTEADRLRWYGLDQPSLLAGRPRILSGDEARWRATATPPVRGTDAIHRYGELATLQVTLGVPIVLDGRLEAFLNLDSHSDPEAFGEESVEVAAMFAHQVAAILKGARLRALLAHQATTDPLTGVGNRRYVEQRLAEELSRAGRSGVPFAFALLDVVGLKQANDASGHAAGDRLLREVASTLQGSVRGSDVVCRYGGDEFVLLLPGARAGEAERVLARAVETLSGRRGPWGEGIPVSVGIAVFPDDGGTAEALAADADRRMYLARKLGRSVCAHD